MDLIINLIRLFLLALVLAFVAVFIRRRTRRKAAQEAWLRGAVDHPAQEQSAAEASSLPKASGASQELESRLWYGEESSFIFKLNEKIALTMDRRQIAESVVEELSRFLNVQSCVLFLKEDDGGERPA